MILSVENSNTKIYDFDYRHLNMLGGVLRYPTPLGIAKEEGFIDPEDLGMAGSWDGWVRMLHTPKTKPPWFPTGLLGIALAWLQYYNIPVAMNDERTRPDEGMPELIDIPLRDYQKEAVRLGWGAGRGVYDMPPRSGKTRMAAELVRGLALPTIWMAPTDRIVTQTHEVLEGFFGKNHAVQIVGSKQPKSVYQAEIVLCTAATAVRLSPEFYASRKVIVVDEFHRAAARSYKKIFGMCEHIYYRYGMTGTFFRSGEDAMAMHALLSNTIYKITSAELRTLGHLVPVKVVFLPVLSPRLVGVSSSYVTGIGKFGIHEHEWRNKLVCDCVLKLAHRGRKVLILVGTKKQGRYIQDVLAAFYPKVSGAEFKPVEFLHSSVPRPIQGRILQSFEADQEVKVLIGTSLLGEGIDMPSVDALVYARGEKAEVSLTQNMYRIATSVPGKKEALLVDFSDRHRARLLEHSKDRLQVYYDEPNFSVEVLPDTRLFDGWLNQVTKN